MKLFKVSTVKDGAWSTAVMVRETRIGNYIRAQAVTAGQTFSIEYVADEEVEAPAAAEAKPEPAPAEAAAQ